MAETGGSFLKTLVILCIIGGLIAAGLWYIKNSSDKGSIAYIATKKIIEIKEKYIPTGPIKATEPTAKMPNQPAPQNESLNGQVTENNAPVVINRPTETEIQEPEVSEEILDESIVPTEQVEEEIEEIAPLSAEVAHEVPLSDIPSGEAELVSQETDETIPSPQNPSIQNVTYTWADFNSGKKCNASDRFSIQEEEILRLVRSYCKHPKLDAWNQWLQNFREAKKTYFIQKKMKENTKYIKYLKVIPHLLFDIHNTQNNGVSIEAKLDQIETAILKHQTQKAVDLMTDLDDSSIRLNFSTVQTEGENLLRIQNAFENQLNEEEAND